MKKLKLLDRPKLVIEKGIAYIKNMFKTIKHYDINSLYPSVMQNKEFPTDLSGKFIGDIRLIKAYAHYYNDNLGTYKVNVKAPNIKNPLLPIKINNQVVYPQGE